LANDKVEIVRESYIADGVCFVAFPLLQECLITGLDGEESRLDLRPYDERKRPLSTFGRCFWLCYVTTA